MTAAAKRYRLSRRVAVNAQTAPGAIGIFFERNGFTRLIFLFGRAFHRPEISRGPNTFVLVCGWFALSRIR